MLYLTSIDMNLFKQMPGRGKERPCDQHDVGLKEEMFHFQIPGQTLLPYLKTKQILPDLSEELLTNAASDKEIIITDGFGDEREVQSSLAATNLTTLSGQHMRKLIHSLFYLPSMSILIQWLYQHEIQMPFFYRHHI